MRIRSFKKVILYLIIAIMMLPFQDIFGQKRSGTRPPAVAGQFYPGTEIALKSKLSEAWTSVEIANNSDPVRALIVPHAGYDYSGQIAANAYAQLSSLDDYQNIFLLASSHQVDLGKASVYTAGDYITPLGRVAVNTSIAKKLCKEDCIGFEPVAHQNEHSIEVQLPFLQFFEKVPPIIPIVLAEQSTELAAELAAALQPYFTPENLFIISADFSHYPKYEDARRLDKLTADALCTGNAEIFLNAIADNARSGTRGLATSMCAWPAALTLLYLMNHHANLYFEQLAYANSGDISPNGDKKKVVGYHAIALRDQVHPGGFYLSHQDRLNLIRLARNTLNHYVFKTGESPTPVHLSVDSRAGAFVTLKLDGKLRGCLGNFQPTNTLEKLIPELTIASASRDSRFLPVSAEEVKDIEIEISILTPLNKIDDPKDIVLGKHGVYIKKGIHSGTFLPQVATETGWSLEEFLGHCARDKAGLTWDDWKTADIYTYEAIVFKELK